MIRPIIFETVSSRFSKTCPEKKKKRNQYILNIKIHIKCLLRFMTRTIFQIFVIQK